MSEKLKRPENPLVILILGGTTTLARPLVQYLLDEKVTRASFIRLVDRYCIKPPTTYLDKRFLARLDEPQPRLEYKQVNLGLPEKHIEVFTPPSRWNGAETGWKAFDVVYDLTGDTAFDKAELLQITHTYQRALVLAQSAAKLPAESKPRAYVRLTFPFYEMKSPPSSSSAGYDETADLRPDGVRGRWWHETLRGLGKIEGLNSGAIRCGAWYGRGTWEGDVIPRLVIGQVYQHLKEEMKFLHNSDLRINTVHTLDIAQALYLLSIYLLSNSRETVLRDSGVNIPFSFSSPPSSTFSLGKDKRTRMSETWKTVNTVVPEKEKIVLPLFNVVDNGDSTQETLARAVSQVWGIKYGFFNSTVASLAQQFSKTGLSEIVEEVNEEHVEVWSKLLDESKPPITSTPITPFLDEHAFRKLAICLDGANARKILGFSPTIPRVEVDELKAIVKGFQDDGVWPKT